MLAIVAGKDLVVDNQTTKRFIEESGNERSKVIEIADADHMTINNDEEFALEMI